MTKTLISAYWNPFENKAQKKYYDDKHQSVILVNDNKYKNWWLSNEQNDSPVKLYDALHDKSVTLYKQEYGKVDPLKINYEHNLRKHHQYLLTQLLICGANYDNNDELAIGELDGIQQKALNKMLPNALNQEYKDYLKYYSLLLSQPIPEIKRLAVDIEVYVEDGESFPSLREHKNVITCVGFAGSDGYRATFTLDNGLHKRNNNGEHITYFKSEKELIKSALAVMNSYPMIITFNGDNFDLAYLHMRANETFQLPTEIIFNKMDIGKNPLLRDAVLIRRGIHLDLFRIFQNKSLHNYAFNAKYKQFSLDDVAKAMIGEGKIKNDKSLNQLTCEELSKYCLNDAEITLKLTTYSKSLLMKLLILISRITKTSIEDIGRFGISNWIRQMLYFEHRKRKFLIPNRDELVIKGAGETSAVIKGKKYAGAMVITPESGSFFNVSVVDFASLYPSIIKQYNISYETINCGHDECMKHSIPNTKHYTCTKKVGMLPLLIGVFRDLRVEYFKKLSKSLEGDEKDIFDAVAQAVKVILNGTYGVMGTDSFQLYCVPVAESITAVGRYIINETKEYVEKMGLKVIYGDTDSLFIHNANKDQLETIMKRTNKTYAIDLEVDKEYRYIIFAALKKNYLGVKPDGKLDVKGLVGKKSHIPKAIKYCFNDICSELQKVNNKPELEAAKVTIGNIVKDYSYKLHKLKFPLEEYAFNAMVNKKLEDYGTVVEESGIDTTQLSLELGEVYKEEKRKGVPIHVKVAMEMREEGEVITERTFIPYIKAKGEVGKPLSKAIHTDIDIPKYIETLQSVVDPILTVLGLEFATLSLHQQKTLDELFA